MFDIFCPNYQEGINGETTSGQTSLYNCIAYSVWNEFTYIWPDPDEEYAWPPTIPRNDSIEAFLEFYRLCGFEQCVDIVPEPGHEKIIIYELNGRVAHAARQLNDRQWTSKVGDLTDVMHINPEVVESERNGYPTYAVRRPWTGTPPQLPPLHPPLTDLVDPQGQPLT